MSRTTVDTLTATLLATFHARMQQQRQLGKSSRHVAAARCGTRSLVSSLKVIAATPPAPPVAEVPDFASRMEVL